MLRNYIKTSMRALLKQKGFTIIILLVSLLASQKIKEIGVRKVFGASLFNIIVLLSKDYIKLILIGFVISIPVINYFITDWLSQLKYNKAGLVVVSGLGAIGIAHRTHFCELAINQSSVAETCTKFER